MPQPKLVLFLIKMCVQVWTSVSENTSGQEPNKTCTSMPGYPLQSADWKGGSEPPLMYRLKLIKYIV